MINLFAQLLITVVLLWGASTTPAVNYNVYRETISGACTPTSLGTGPSCQKLNATPLSVLTYSDLSAPVGVKSFYVVRAVNSSGFESVNSNQITVDLTAPNAVVVTCTINIGSSPVSGVCK